ncbi:MAG: hypothetical protein CR994_00655 [Maribacter sp.]|nr:MAG: hypothetical protein CR994_00655 [Maribacter sp.]
MKGSLILFCLALGLSYTLPAQNCGNYYPMVEGATFEYTNYNKKGKKEGIAKYKVSEVNTSGDVTNATMSIELVDEEGKELYKTDYKFACTDNTVSIDYESLIPSSTLQQFKDMEIDVSGTDLELPNDLSVGQELPDANVAIKVSMNGINMNTTVDMINRKVEKKESVTTPAGTFDCYVIYNDNKMKAMMVNSTMGSRIWYSEGVGMVKQESYKKNGKIITSTVLTAFSK